MSLLVAVVADVLRLGSVLSPKSSETLLPLLGEHFLDVCRELFLRAGRLDEGVLQQLFRSESLLHLRMGVYFGGEGVQLAITCS